MALDPDYIGTFHLFPFPTTNPLHVIPLGFLSAEAVFCEDLMGCSGREEAGKFYYATGKFSAKYQDIKIPEKPVSQTPKKIKIVTT